MELNGDLRLAALDRWRYVSGNLLRNIGRSSLRPMRFLPGPAGVRGAPSPSRSRITASAVTDHSTERRWIFGGDGSHVFEPRTHQTT